MSPDHAATRTCTSLGARPHDATPSASPDPAFYGLHRISRNSPAMGALLAKTGVTSIRTLVMLMGGVAVDNLKKKMRALPKLRGISIPRSVRRAMVKALTTSSWFALLGVFRCECCQSVVSVMLSCCL